MSHNFNFIQKPARMRSGGRSIGISTVGIYELHVSDMHFLKMDANGYGT
jgi:hypothetical protein